MTNAETPAENTGGDTATPTGPLGELPARVRVHALAKLLGSNSRDVLAKLTELGETVRSAQSSVPKDVAIRVAEAFAAPAEEVVPEAPEAPQPEAAESDTTELTAPPEVEAAEEAEPEPVRPLAHVPVFAAPSPVFLPPEPPVARPEPKPQEEEPAEDEQAEAPERDERDKDDDGEDRSARRRRRRGRRGRGRGKGGEDSAGGEDESAEQPEQAEEARAEDEAKPEAEAESEDDDADEAETGTSRRRRRRRRRKASDDDGAEATSDDPPNTVVHVRDSKPEADKSAKEPKDKGDGVRSVRGSTRLEAKRQRRRDGREAGRRRAPILSEAEFLARREAVERTMVVAERGDHTQIGVLEDGVLVEHFVTSHGSGSIVGNVYLGRVQNVLPSMEAAFVDIGRGRNAVLYAGEVDWDAAGLEGKSRKIEQALSTGDNVLVQVTKDPVGHKGARLTTQISLPGRFLVYVPSGGATGISRKLPENERRRLKDILKRIVPEDAGVIIRTASEGISEEELERDVRRLKAQWEVIKEKADAAGGGKKSAAPTMLYEEPDLLVKVVRDLFTEDFAKLEVQGDTAWETINAYVNHVAPDLAGRLKRYVGTGDVFTDYRIDEQITKALDRKVWLPSGGYLVIDRTEAMTVIDVNTGKFTGSGGNLEETVTRNNLESAEEIVRQLRLRDIGGIIVIDFIDMVLESNRELVLRRLTECLGRDRTRHQVAEVTSLGLVQMTRKKVGTGLLEAFSTTCEHCKGRGVVISTEPQRAGNGGGSNGNGNQHGGGGSRRARGRGKGAEEPQQAEAGGKNVQRESVVSAVQAMAHAAKLASSGKPEDEAEQAAEETAEQVVTAALNGRHEAPGEPVHEQTDTVPEAETSAADRPTTRRAHRRARAAERNAQAATSASDASSGSGGSGGSGAEAAAAGSAAGAEAGAEAAGQGSQAAESGADAGQGAQAAESGAAAVGSAAAGAAAAEPGAEVPQSAEPRTGAAESVSPAGQPAATAEPGAQPAAESSAPTEPTPPVSEPATESSTRPTGQEPDEAQQAATEPGEAQPTTAEPTGHQPGTASSNEGRPSPSGEGQEPAASAASEPQQPATSAPGEGHPAPASGEQASGEPQRPAAESNGAERPAPAAQAAQEPGQPAQESARAAQEPGQHATEQPAAQEPTGATEQPEVDVPTPAVRTARRRPRRAASRPAGPPVHASDQS
ncbi:ribonuclease E [Amycolatopsis sacchari]|uniref:Ribonuclease E n=1 Tax=Amycolatopsis sacchari TaxID=115433 RepID=A0A1I3YPK6_9PSEU|nr:Rne/Rng family ribonuclease [Amycolatopsis sacchari]SFK33201.1 ribonuclease E [Amycolatopsis sacchari]